MAQPFATGAIHIFVRFGGVGSPSYLGTCESMPQDSRAPEYEPVMNDVSGSKVPLDFAYEGESSQISMILTRWNEDIAQSITTPPGLTSTDGSWAWADVGTLMGLEEWFTEVWLVRTYGAVLAARTAYTSQGMQAGRHYVQTILWAPQTDETGTKPMKRHFMFYAWPKINHTTKRFVLFDQDFTGISNNLID